MTHPNQIVRDGTLRVLYGLDVGGAEPGEDLTARIDRNVALTSEVAPEIEQRHADIIERIEALYDSWESINEKIQSVSPNWRVDRMSIIDRNILRMATWEIEHGDEAAAVVIDASVELGKTYGATETSGFVNGLLDEFCKSQDIDVHG
jgi:N utilization substance protein B